MNFGVTSSTSIIGFIAMAFLFVRYAMFSNISWWGKLILFVVFVGIGFLPQLGKYEFEDFWGAAYPVVCNIISYVYMTAIILVTITVIRDAGWLILYLCGVTPSPMAIPSVVRANLITLVVAAIMGGYALYVGLRTPPVRVVTISSPKITAEYKIAALPDLHIQRTTALRRIKNIVDVVNEQHVNAAVLLGDTIDDELSRIMPGLQMLTDISAPDGIYFVTGNHETYLGYDTSVAALKGMGFTFLENSGVSLRDDIYLGGFPDIHSSRRSGHRYDMAKTFENANAGQFRLLASHTPGTFKNNDFDLEIAGHTHGGQIIPIIFLMYLHAPFLAGEYELHDGAKIYVSRGISQGGPQMRLFAPNEITVIKLVPQSGGKM
mgnify:CR=1 FL=1